MSSLNKRGETELGESKQKQRAKTGKDQRTKKDKGRKRGNGTSNYYHRWIFSKKSFDINSSFPEVKDNGDYCLSRLNVGALRRDWLKTCFLSFSRCPTGKMPDESGNEDDT